MTIDRDLTEARAVPAQQTSEVLDFAAAVRVERVERVERAHLTNFEGSSIISGSLIAAPEARGFVGCFT
jgi:hypothetical protein